MHSVSIFLSFVASAAAAAITPQVAPLPVGQLGWEGAVAPGGPVMEVWGDSFEVCLPSSTSVRGSLLTD